MGTTSEKLTYLNVTKQKLKQAINNIGGEVTDETTFRQYVNQLENAYDRLPKTEFEEGESVTLENGLKGKLDFDDGKVGFGQASQESTQGYNLLPHTTTTGQSGNSNGIVWETLEDGGIKIKGTTTAQVVITYTRGMEFTLEAGTYVIKNTNFAQYMKLQIWYSAATLWWELMGANTQTKVLSEDTTFENFRSQIVIPSGTTIDTTIYVQLEKGSSTHTFEKYSGGYVSPSPNWKQKVECVAGKNMFKDGITFQTSSSNWSDQLGTSTTTVAQIKLNSNYYDLDADTPYTFKLKSYANIDYLQVVYLDENEAIQALLGYSDLTNAKTFVPVKPLRVWVRARVTNGNTDTYFIGQLEKGYVATPYLPYNTIEEVVSGINKLSYAEAQTEMVGTLECKSNGDGTYTMNGTSSISGGYDFQISSGYTIKEGDYFFINNNKTNSNVAIALKASSEDQIAAPAINVVNRSLDLTQYAGRTINYIRLYANSGQTLDNLVVKPFIYNSSTQVPFEPYITPKTYQFSLGEHKFYGIGDYADELLYDVDEDKVYKNGYINEIGKDEALQRLSSGYYELTDVVRSVINLGDLPSSTSSANGLCSHLVFLADFTRNIEHFYVQGTQIFFFIKKSRLSEISRTGIYNYLNTLTDLKFCYVMNTPIETEITNETLHAQVKAWYYGQSLDGTTIIEGNGDLPMIIKVRGLKGE